jgi:hypothetical protein
MVEQRFDQRLTTGMASSSIIRVDDATILCHIQTACCSGNQLGMYSMCTACVYSMCTACVYSMCTACVYCLHGVLAVRVMIWCLGTSVSMLGCRSGVLLCAYALCMWDC